MEGPYITLDIEKAMQFVTNLTDSSVVGFRYLSFSGGEKTCRLRVQGGGGEVTVFTDDSMINPVGRGRIAPCDKWYDADVEILPQTGSRPLLLSFSLEGAAELESVRILLAE